MRHWGAHGRDRSRNGGRARLGLSLAVVVGLLAVSQVGVEPAGAAFRALNMAHGGTLSIRSSDACRIKVVKTTFKKIARRDFSCIKSGKLTLTPVGAASPRQQMLVHGDTLAIVSADGCKVKPVKTIYPTRWRRDFKCNITGRALAPQPPPPPPPPPPNTAQPPSAVTGGATWRSIFADEFDGTAVDTTKWNVPNNSNFGSGNDEDHCYRSANTTVTGGTLRFTARRQSVTGCGNNPDGGSTYYFTSGMATTRAQDGRLKMSFRRGYTEIQARVPRGNIYWSAFWLADPLDGTSPGWPAYGEIDAVEIYGSRPDVSESNFWRAGGDIGARPHNVNNPPSSSTGVGINPPNAFVTGGTNGWHRYGINWTATQLQWFVDGVLVRTFTASSNADLAALGYTKGIILNLALGGTGPQFHGYTGGERNGTYDNGNLVADLPGVMEVDYVRVWQP